MMTILARLILPIETLVLRSTRKRAAKQRCCRHLAPFCAAPTLAARHPRGYRSPKGATETWARNLRIAALHNLWLCGSHARYADQGPQLCEAAVYRQGEIIPFGQESF